MLLNVSGSYENCCGHQNPPKPGAVRVPDRRFVHSHTRTRSTAVWSIRHRSGASLAMAATIVETSVITSLSKDSTGTRFLGFSGANLSISSRLSPPMFQHHERERRFVAQDIRSKRTRSGCIPKLDFWHSQYFLRKNRIDRSKNQ